MKTVNTSQISFMDTSDNRKLEAYIASNLPTVQVYDPNDNPATYTPDWTSTNLTLTADIFIDSTTEVTNGAVITWYIKGQDESIGEGRILTVNTNITSETKIVTYICKAEYQGLFAQSQIVFTRVDNGTTGAEGPMGAEAKVVKLNADNQIIKIDKDGNVTPSIITITPSLQGFTNEAFKWKFRWGASWDSGPPYRRATTEDDTSADNPYVYIVLKKDNEGNEIEVPYISCIPVEQWSQSLNASDELVGLTINSELLLNNTTSDYLSIKLAHTDRRGIEYCDIITIRKVSDGVDGADGENGFSYYTWIKYADDENGTNMGDEPEGKKYIGLAYNQVNQDETTNPGDYKWSLIQGETGATGQNGTTYYTWIRYADDADGGGMSDNPDGKKYIGIAYEKDTSIESDNPDDYDWAQFRGDDGIDGEMGESAPVAFLTNENVSFSANAEGEILGTTVQTNIVAYVGIEKVLPTIGAITNVPTGMTITMGAVDNYEIPLTITIEDGATLGSIANNYGVINIPITSPIETSLQLTWNKINSGKDGAGATTVFLTNENITFAANSNGQIVNDTTFTTDIVAYSGIDAVDVVVDRANIIAQSDIKVSKIENSVITFSIAANSNLGSSGSTNGTIDIPITSPILSTLHLTWSKVNSGADGEVPKHITLSADSHIFKVDSGGNVIPSTITITPSVQGFTNEKFKWRFMTDKSTNWSTTPPAVSGGDATNEYSYEVDGKGYYTTCIPTQQWKGDNFDFNSLTALTIDCNKLLNYGSNSLSIKLSNSDAYYDIITIHKVSDGVDGIDGITFQIYAPQGTVLQDDVESIELQTFAYDGDTAITTATYQWFKYIADTDSWSQVGTGSVLTVSHTEVLGAQTYQCTMSYKGNPYNDTVTITDKTDIYQVEITSVDGTVFTVGDEGAIVYATLYKNGEVVDSPLGDMGTQLPESAVANTYFYQVSTDDNPSVVLKQYQSGSWVTVQNQSNYTYVWTAIISSEMVSVVSSGAVAFFPSSIIQKSGILQCEVHKANTSIDATTRLTSAQTVFLDLNDPIVSNLAPTPAIDGMMWVDTSGEYPILKIYKKSEEDETVGEWQVFGSSRHNIFTEKPENKLDDGYYYHKGDVWIVSAEDAQDLEDAGVTTIINGTVASIPVGSILIAASDNKAGFSISDWSYDKETNASTEFYAGLAYYLNFSISDGLTIGDIREGDTSFFTRITSTEMGFYEREQTDNGTKDTKVAYISNKKLNIEEAEIKGRITVNNELRIGNFRFIVEANGSLSIVGA